MGVVSDTARSPRMRARALWILAKSGIGSMATSKALDDAEPDLRVAALRAIRLNEPKRAISAIAQLVSDPDARVRRDAAIALRFDDGERADALWATLARQFEPGDRWMLEALGIGADLHPESRFATYLPEDFVGEPAEAVEAFSEISWRIRAPQAAKSELMGYLTASNPVPMPST